MCCGRRSHYAAAAAEATTSRARSAGTEGGGGEARQEDYGFRSFGEPFYFKVHRFLSPRAPPPLWRMTKAISLLKFVRGRLVRRGLSRCIASNSSWSSFCATGTYVITCPVASLRMCLHFPSLPPARCRMIYGRLGRQSGSALHLFVLCRSRYVYEGGRETLRRRGADASEQWITTT